jgi:hypothetical protein
VNLKLLFIEGEFRISIVSPLRMDLTGRSAKNERIRLSVDTAQTKAEDVSLICLLLNPFHELNC